MDLLTTLMGIDETMGIFLVRHRPKGEIFHKITYTVSLEVINLTILLSADLTVIQRLVLRPMKKNSRRTIIRHHLMWFAVPQPMVLIMNYQIFVR